MTTITEKMMNRALEWMGHSLEVRTGTYLRLAKVLEEIADADYRGNRSPESERAHRVLVEEELRA